MGREARLQDRRVLVVEDHFYLASDIQAWLEGAGATVLGPVASIEKAVGLLDSAAIDAAVVDINLGLGPTYELARILSDLGIPFLFATGYDADAIPPELRSSPRLEKPFDGRDLVDAVAGLVTAGIVPDLPITSRATSALAH